MAISNRYSAPTPTLVVPIPAQIFKRTHTQLLKGNFTEIEDSLSPTDKPVLEALSQQVILRDHVTHPLMAVVNQLKLMGTSPLASDLPYYKKQEAPSSPIETSEHLYNLTVSKCGCVHPHSKVIDAVEIFKTNTNGLVRVIALVLYTDIFDTTYQERAVSIFNALQEADVDLASTSRIMGQNLQIAAEALYTPDS